MAESPFFNRLLYRTRLKLTLTRSVSEEATPVLAYAAGECEMCHPQPSVALAPVLNKTTGASAQRLIYGTVPDPA